MALLALACAPLAAARGATVVSLTFDDGAATQLIARDQLAAHGMRGTFFINSGKVGSDPYYDMTWTDVASVAAAGDEIGGHTLDHKDLTSLKAGEQRSQVCDDRSNLQGHGFDPVSFAYPYGAFNAAVEEIVAECGYASARTVGGLSHSGCGDCVDAESIPPLRAFAVRSNPAADPGGGPMSVSELQGYVTQAESAGGGWVPLTFHDICSPCPAAATDDSISPAHLAQFLDWLAARAPGGTVVKTVRSVMGFPDPEPPAPVNAFAPPLTRDRTTGFARLSARKRQRIGRLRVSAMMAEPGRLSAFGSVKLGKRYRLEKVSKTAIPGKPVVLRLKLSKKGLRAARRALRRRNVRAVITITATDVAGNSVSAKRRIRLRP